ncbi:hypothetical protein PN492_19355 [Dolichospermum circinale CS-537/01]|uniref:ApeA N-terminal domain-containing protein n=1 Tax=Dolichospermum circinale CS-537/01 TaxID=3021739 RepID=A0ABT5A9P3_9CYAN|nr:hypothetical protein [Dolichospermum circinale]MDB9488679.1 hypothetical protein [Dolichospermum circinale CS-537/01]
MFRGKITFQAEFNFFLFESIEFAYPDSKVLLATVKSSQFEGVILTVEIINASSKNEIFIKAREVADYTTKVLTWKFEWVFKKFRQVDEKIVEEQLQPDGSIREIFHNPEPVLKIGGGASKQWLDFGSSQESEIKSLLEQDNLNRFIYCDLFCFAIELTDPISKFMILYYIILDLCNDNQDDVDQFIISFEPNVPTNPPYRTRRSGVSETIYTRLRNQIGHARRGTTMEHTRSEMATNLKGLIAIAKELIIRNSF